MTVAPVLVSNKFTLDLAKQAAWGTPAANPDYRIPFYDGTDIGPTEERTKLELINGQAYLPGEYKTAAGGGGTAVFAAHPDSNGRIFAAHFGTASDTMTGAGDPRTHTFVRKDTDLPHTVWIGGPLSTSTTQYDKLVDAICTGLQIMYSSGQFLKIGTTWLSASSLGNATTPTPGTTIGIPAAGVYGHTWARAVLKIDAAATPGTTPVTNLTDFTITSAYPNAKFVQTQNLNGDFFSRGLWELDFTATGLMANRDYYNHTYYGTASPGANAAQSSAAPSGSVDFLIDQEPTSTNRMLQLQIPYTQISIDSRPSPAANADALTVAIKGTLSLPASGEPFTVIQKTAVATSYS